MRMTKRKKQALETKIKITQCALDLYKEKSSNEVTVSEICNAANVSVGAFYHHFETKDDIISNAYASLDELTVDAVEDQQFDTYLEKTICIFRQSVTVLSQYGYKFATQAYKVMLANHDDATFNKERSSYQLIVSCLDLARENNELDCDYSSEELTDYLMRCGRGIIFDWCLKQGSYNIMDEMEKEVRFNLKYLNKLSAKDE